MDVDQRYEHEVARDRAHATATATARPSNSWVLPVAVAAAVVVGALSVPFLMWLGPLLTSPSEQAQVVAASTSAASGENGETMSSAVPTRRLAVPTVAPTASLAAPPPAPPKRTVVVSTSADLGGRQASVEPARGVGGQLATVTGKCRPGTDAQVAVSGAAKQTVGADGSFSVRVQVGSSAGVGQTAAVQVTCLPAGGGKGVSFTAPFTVTAVVTMPRQIGNAGSLDVQQSGGQAEAAAAGFLPGTPVLFEVRNVDTGATESQRRVLADDAGAVDILGVTLGTGTQQLVICGIGDDGSRRLLAGTVTVEGPPSSPSAAAVTPSQTPAA